MWRMLLTSADQRIVVTHIDKEALVCWVIVHVSPLLPRILGFLMMALRLAE